MRHLATLTLAALLLAPLAGAHEDDPKILDRRSAWRGPALQNARISSPAQHARSMLLGTAPFESQGVRLLSWLTLSEFGFPANGNDCWGYVAPSGREYALFAHSSGTAFVEITNPGAPSIVANISGPGSLWRDVKVYGHHAYSVSEGGGGIQVFDMSAIDSGSVIELAPVLTGGIGATHNVAIDEDSGFLYRLGGTGEGMRIYDLANPASPQYVTSWSTRYFHDAQIVTYTSGPYAGKQIVFGFSGDNDGWSNAGLDIVDVTDKQNLVDLAHISYSNPSYSHQGWLSEDRKYLYLGDELDEDGVLPTTTYVIDVQNLAAPFEAGSFTNGNQAVGHNLYTMGDRIFAANYTSGLRVFDASNPLAPVEVAWFDTWSQSDNDTYNSLWSVYPYLPSGVVIGSDLEKGLFLWWVGDAPIQFHFPGGLPGLLDPAGETVALDIVEESPGDYVAGTAMLHLDAGAGFTSVPLSDLGGGSFEADFGSLPCASAVSYYFTAATQNGLVWAHPADAPLELLAAVAATSEVPLSVDDLEATSGWTVGQVGDTATSGVWTLVDPNGDGAQPEDDHTPAGSMCFVTGQAGAGAAAGTEDVDGGWTTLVSPSYDLTGLTQPVIRYWRWYSNATGPAPGEDTLDVDISGDGVGWTKVEVVGPDGPETIGGWLQHSIRVKEYISPTAAVRLRFVASDNGAGSIVEAAIDDLEVLDYDCGTSVGVPYCLGDGSDGASCPCGNAAASGSGEGCVNGSGVGARLTASGVPSIASDTLVLAIDGGFPGEFGMFVSNTTDAAPHGALFNGYLCLPADSSLDRYFAPPASVQALDGGGSGASTFSLSLADNTNLPATTTAGATLHYQLWYRDDPSGSMGPAGGPCGLGANLSAGVRVIWIP